MNMFVLLKASSVVMKIGQAWSMKPSEGIATEPKLNMRV